MMMIHVIAGLLALPAGAVAMTAPKGGWLHRQAGIVFVCAMLVMSSLGTLLAAMRPSLISVVAGVLTFYLVATAVLTMRYTVERASRWIRVLMLLALADGIFAVWLTAVALNSERGALQGVPAAMYVVFAVIALLAALGDARLLGMRNIQGTARLTRHLWRMGLAMFIACASLFLGQAKVFPEPLRNFALLSIPVVLTLVHLLYWLVRVRLKQPLRTVSP